MIAGLIARFGTGLLLKVLAGVAILVTILGVLAKVKSAGRMEERVEGMKSQLSNVKERQNVEDRIARADPVERQRLRDKWTRP